MGILQKLSTVIKSNINDLISRAENPEKMLNQIILDMRDQLAKAKREVAPPSPTSGSSSRSSTPR
jgi:phage shock protein A